AGSAHARRARTRLRRQGELGRRKGELHEIESPTRTAEIKSQREERAYGVLTVRRRRAPDRQGATKSIDSFDTQPQYSSFVKSNAKTRLRAIRRTSRAGPMGR